MTGILAHADSEGRSPNQASRYPHRNNTTTMHHTYKAGGLWQTYKRQLQGPGEKKQKHDYNSCKFPSLGNLCIYISISPQIRLCKLLFHGSSHLPDVGQTTDDSIRKIGFFNAVGQVERNSWHHCAVHPTLPGTRMSTMITQGHAK